MWINEKKLKLMINEAIEIRAMVMDLNIEEAKRKLNKSLEGFEKHLKKIDDRNEAFNDEKRAWRTEEIVARDAHHEMLMAFLKEMQFK